MQGGRWLWSSCTCSFSGHPRQHGTDTLAGEKLADERVWYAAVQDMHAWHRLERAQACLDLGNHAAADRPVLDHPLDGLAAELGQDLAVGVEHTWHVGEQDELFCAERPRHLASHGVRVDVERL